MQGLSLLQHMRISAHHASGLLAPSSALASSSAPATASQWQACHGGSPCRHQSTSGGDREHAAGGQGPASGPSKATTVDELKKESPTGKLLDLFSTPGGGTQDPGASASPHAAPATPRGRGAAGRRSQQASQDARQDVVGLVLQAVENCKPLMKVQSIKTGTRIVYVPKVVMPNEQRSLSVRCVQACIRPMAIMLVWCSLSAES
jgi:hypothetical protein